MDVTTESVLAVTRQRLSTVATGTSSTELTEAAVFVCRTSSTSMGTSVLGNRLATTDLLPAGVPAAELGRDCGRTAAAGVAGSAKVQVGTETIGECASFAVLLIAPLLVLV